MVGINPIAPVPSAMPTSVMMKVYLRPTTSPSQPNTNAPNGRTRNPAVNSAIVLSRAATGVALIEEFDRQDRGQAPENIEIIPFDNVSPRRGGDDASEVCWNARSHSYLPCCRRSCCGNPEGFPTSHRP